MHCKNCNTFLPEQSDYCNSCGGKVVRNRLTLKNLSKDFGETYLNLDNKFLQTFMALFSKPESVIGSYINGTRKKYVNVVSYFALALTFTGLEYFIINKFFPEFSDLSAISRKGTEAFTNSFLKYVQEYQSFILMMFIPIYAFMAKVVFFDLKKFNYTELLVTFMYIIAHLTIIGTIIIIPSATLGLKMGNLSPYVLILQIAYSAYCLKRLYKLRLKGILLRTCLFLAVLTVVYIMSTLLVVGILILMKGPDFFNEIIEAQNAVNPG